MHRWDAVIGIVREVVLQPVTVLVKEVVIHPVKPTVKVPVRVLVLANALPPINIKKKQGV